MRECTKRILELADDRAKLKAERAEAKDLRGRIQGEGKDTRNANKNKKRYVVDEEAYYNRKDEDDDTKKANTGTKSSPSKQYDSHPREPNLARKLGLDEDDAEEVKAKTEKDKNKKKTKEELEKEKEIDEVRKIIENDSKLNKYIKEIDLLGIDVEDSHTPNINSGGMKSKNSKLNLID